jgi:hypothetical protein
MLTDTQIRKVRSLRAPRKLFDGRGLYLLVAPEHRVDAPKQAIVPVRYAIQVGGKSISRQVDLIARSTTSLPSHARAQGDEKLI